MIRYDRLWETMRKRGITQYDLDTHHKVNRSQLDRLCNILQCRVEDIMEHFSDENQF
jgi:DNA-binding Xre family transcriptional regulator